MKVPWYYGKKLIIYFASYRFRQRVSKILLERLRDFRFMDAVTIAFSIWLGLSIALFCKNVDNWYIFLGSRVIVICTLIGITYRAKHKDLKSYTWNLLKNWYPWVISVFVYKEMGWLIFMFFPYWFDHLFIEIDHAMFGVHPSIWLANHFNSPVLIELMHASYCTYYIMTPLLGAVLYFYKKNMRAFQDFITAIIMSYYTAYILYVTFPAEGPRYALAAQGAVQLEKGWIFTKFVSFLMATEALHGGAFPSAHCSVALTYIVFSYKYARKLFYVTFPFAFGLFIACVYGRYHYVIDVIFGILIAAFWCWASPKINNWWNEKIMIYNAFPNFSKIFESEDIITGKKLHPLISDYSYQPNNPK